MQGMDNQIKQLSMQLQAAMKELNDKGADRAVALQKIEKDFEAKLLGIIQKAEQASAGNANAIAKDLLGHELGKEMAGVEVQNQAAASQQSHQQGLEASDHSFEQQQSVAKDEKPT